MMRIVTFVSVRNRRKINAVVVKTEIFKAVYLYIISFADVGKKLIPAAVDAAERVTA